jgi:hypothetical protein
MHCVITENFIGQISAHAPHGCPCVSTVLIKIYPPVDHFKDDVSAA